MRKANNFPHLSVALLITGCRLRHMVGNNSKENEMSNSVKEHNSNILKFVQIMENTIAQYKEVGLNTWGLEREIESLLEQVVEVDC